MKIDRYRPVKSELYQIIPVDLLNRSDSNESDKETYKKTVSRLVNMNANFKKAGKVFQNAETGEKEFFEFPQVSFKWWKQKDMVEQWINIPVNSQINKKIKEAIEEDMLSCKWSTGELELPPENQMRGFAVQGSHYASISLVNEIGPALQILLQKHENLLVNITVREAEDHVYLRKQLLKEKEGGADWKAGTKMVMKKVLQSFQEVLVDEEIKGKIEKYSKYLPERKSKKSKVEISRKLQSETNRYVYAEILFLTWSQNTKYLERDIQQLLESIQGEEELQLIQVNPMLENIKKGRQDPSIPTLCLYQTELSQILYLPKIQDLPDSFYQERTRKTEIPKEMYTNEPGSIGIGRDLDNNRYVALPPSTTKSGLDDRVTPTLIAGKQGSGKSTFLVNQILETFYVTAKDRNDWIKHARSIISFDVADGQTIADVLEHIPEWLQDRVIVLNHANTQEPIPVNFHDVLSLNRYLQNDSYESEIAALETQILLDVLEDGSNTLSINRYFKNALQASYIAGKGTILDAMRILVDQDYRIKIRESLREDQILLKVELKQFDQELSEKSSKVLETIERRISMIRNDYALLDCISQEPMDGVDFWKWMNGDENGPYLVLIYLPKNGISTMCRKYLFTHYILKIWRLMLAREILPKEQRKEVLIQIDELHQVLDQKSVLDIFSDIFKEPRKYRARFLFSLHGWSSIKAGSKRKEIIQSMMDSGSNLIMLKGGDEMFNSLQAMLTPYSNEDFQELMKNPFTGIFKLAVGSRDHTFQLKLLEPASDRLPKYRKVDYKEFRNGSNKQGRLKKAVREYIQMELELMYGLKKEEVQLECPKPKEMKKSKEVLKSEIAKITGGLGSLKTK